MNSSSGDTPEGLLSAALRAQAAGGANPAAPGPPSPGGATPAKPPRRKLPVLGVLLFALLLGLAAGVIIGVLSVT